MSVRVHALVLLCALAGGACTQSHPPADAAAARSCVEGEISCAGALHVTCSGGMSEVRDCSAEGLLCEPLLGCVRCIPDQTACSGSDVARCGAGGTWDIEACDLAAGLGCHAGRCTELCALDGLGSRGCEFYAADLDNSETGAAIPPHTWGVLVVNPWPLPVEVVVEHNEAAFGAPVDVVEIARTVVPPRDVETLALPRRPLDGSTPEAGATHSALTSNAHRIRTSLPVAVYQLNPLHDEGFSADGSRLLPTPALGTRYTVVDWPQTIAHGESPSDDFDPMRSDEDLRVFLAIVGTRERTHVRVQLAPAGPHGPNVVAGGMVPELGGSDVYEIDIGPFDVVNLETHTLNSSFTGTVVEANEPIVVFSGSEASDVPVFATYANRQCCGDHLEEQLVPDPLAGSRFVVGREPSRSAAVNRALGIDAPTADFDTPNWVRIVAVSESVDVRTTLAPPYAGPHLLRRGESVFLPVDRSFHIDAGSGSVHVLQALPSQQAVGIDAHLPSGDPSMVLVSRIETHRAEHAFATPEAFPFDFVTIVARRETSVRLDGEALVSRLAPDGTPACTLEPVAPGLGMPEWVTHHCQLSFPRVIDASGLRVEPGVQNDGAHFVSSDAPVGVMVSGFGRHSSYAYPGELGRVR